METCLKDDGMHIVILSGGSGKRLWPLSNEVRSKQFIKAFKNHRGEYESMVERVYRGIKTAAPDAHITVTTLEGQTSQLLNQLGEGVDICTEPVRRDTFPAVSLACLYLKDRLGVSRDEAVVVCPVDPYVDDDYFTCLKEIGEKALSSSDNLTLMGIRPTYPSEKYGYILTDKNTGAVSFKEKPDLSSAERLLKEGALWNGGIFGFKLGYLLDIVKERTGISSYEELRAAYSHLESVSIDYAVVEKEKSIGVVIYEGEWKDLGTWNMFTEAMSGNCMGKVKTDDTCENTHIINELDIPLLAMGLKNTVVAVGADGILVADKGRSSHMKPYVEELSEPVRYAEKSWGSYRVLDATENSLTVKVTLLPGHSMNYHSHLRRDEIWNVIEGEGKAIVDDKEIPIKAGDSIVLPKGTKHTVKAVTTLQIMEIQTGKDIDAEDKIKY